MQAPPKDKMDDMTRLDAAVLVKAISSLGLQSALTIADVRMNVNLSGTNVRINVSLSGTDVAPRKLSAVSLRPDRLAAVEANQTS
uniref:MIP18 family-like domain-containing protein n=1 Tax=Peronospora matthiolae TaxID=2874970 RepID=A0AAV1TNU6_9STRA